MVLSFVVGFTTPEGLAGLLRAVDKALRHHAVLLMPLQRSPRFIMQENRASLSLLGHEGTAQMRQ